MSRRLEACKGVAATARRAAIHRPDFRCIPLGLLGLMLTFATDESSMGSVAVYVGKNLTQDGSVLLAGFGDEPSSHWLVIEPRREHAPGTTIAVGATETGGYGGAALPGELIQIPQVKETFAYISMDYSYFAGFPAPLTNGGMNEHGLAVRDVALFSRRDLVSMTPNPQRGPQYSDLARIVLERARTAREAVTIATGLIERYGFTTYGGNSHVFADPNEGWVLLEFAGGRGLWVAQRLGPDDVWLNWRGYHGIGYVQSLPGDWRDNPDYLASDNFVSFAVEQGWHRDGETGSFPVIDVYVRPDQYSEASAEEARAVQAAVQAAERNVTPRLLMDLLHASGKDSSGYGQVAHLRADVHPELRTLWVAPSTPLAAPFVPWRLAVQSVPPEYRRHRYLTAGEDARTIDPAARGIESTHYANRVAKRLFYLVEEHPEDFLPEVEAALAQFDAAQLKAQPGIERTADVLFEAGEDALARRYLTEQSHTAAAEAMHLMQALSESIEARTRLQYGIGGDRPGMR